ncbi:phosphodiester glycosidase family protein [Paenibacillus sp. CGMCC 1.16610]|uniref:Phosphodiester glycosidase family protein n=1 Tax=Paenibacillus anseongense TaxID=2682845 RepID=A0ABW9U7T7_9BACL|nr:MULTISPECIES: phosphodiester glycosidase family protein [Paenibacillus]MBA2940324.1 phosphodiester glycosidase family protein [Paenibacillus sp. CGMCC 1.16610]MVQ35501.1 phosphodiester glycosidase family protein [Paenibacillus anseongense]
MTTIQGINRVFLLACAPFVGMLIWLLFVTASIPIHPWSTAPAVPVSFQQESSTLDSLLTKATTDAAQTKTIIQKYFELYEKSTAEVTAALQSATAQVTKPGIIYDARITAKLGSPIRQASSGNIDLKLFALSENNYKGYALKVNLKSDKAIKLVLGKDKMGSSETTLEAVSRYGAIAGVNAGGFADDSKGKRYPLDTTVMNGKYLNGFFPTKNDTIFIGLNKDRQLIGGKFSSQADLDKLNPLMGSTFVPTLLKNGAKATIPYQWQSSPARAARTVMANYKNDQLLFIVTDGYDESGNSGATLAELQDKMQQLGIVDAYNLDGGGSTTLVMGGSVINRPSDGKLRPLATNFLFFK